MASERQRGFELEFVRGKVSEYRERVTSAERRLSKLLSRRGRPRRDLLDRYTREGSTAERWLDFWQKRLDELTGGKWVYHPKVSYPRRQHEATVEISFHKRDFSRMESDEVLDALHDLVKQKARPDIVVDAVWYGQLDADRKGQPRDIRAFLGVVLSGNLETIGEEKK